MHSWQKKIGSFWSRVQLELRKKQFGLLAFALRDLSDTLNGLYALVFDLIPLNDVA